MMDTPAPGPADAIGAAIILGAVAVTGAYYLGEWVGDKISEALESGMSTDGFYNPTGPFAERRKIYMKHTLRLKQIILVTCAFVLLLSHFAYADEMKDDNWNMWHGNQDALILGEVLDVGENTCKLQAVKPLFPKGIITEEYRQLEAEEIPETLNVQGILSYKMSYHDKYQVEQGDCIIVSLDKEGDFWKMNYAPIEVSSSDYQTLVCLPAERETAESFAWDTFIRTDGKLNEFFFEEEDGKIRVIGRGQFEEGTIVEDIIYESAGMGMSIEVTSILVDWLKGHCPPLWSVLLLLLLLIIFCVYKMVKRIQKYKKSKK